MKHFSSQVGRLQDVGVAGPLGLPESDIGTKGGTAARPRAVITMEEEGAGRSY